MGITIYQVKLHKVGTIEFDEKQAISSPSDVAKVACKYLEGADREHVIVLMLNAKYHIVGINTVHVGSLNESVVHPREIFKPAILQNSAAIIICHNHPSGDPTPSPDDHDVTERIYEAGKILGIKLVDHIIIGNDEFTYYSMKQKGNIPD